MSYRFVRCPHCKLPHDAAERVCPTTGRRMPDQSTTGAGATARSRMTELPPPERRPEPLGFDPRQRIPDAPPPAPRPAAVLDTSSVSIPRNVKDELIGKTIGDRYLVKGVLGEGGMGMVYEAEHRGLGRSVAIKVLNPSQAKKRVAVKRFQQEARAAGAIGHPNICEVYDLGSLEDGSPYLVMEKLVGTTLADRIGREGGLPFDEVVDVIQQVLAGLVAAHEKGIVHRDIKPENVFLARRIGAPPIVKILDFGVSKMMPAFQTGEENLDLTRTGMVMGTPYYMSPEQARGERNLDGRVDVYACGVMMYESIAGKRPFLAPNYNALLLAIINTSPKSLREVRPATPPAIESIVGRMMAKARDDRYMTAASVLRDLQAIAPSLQPGRAATPNAPGRPRSPLANRALQERMMSNAPMPAGDSTVNERAGRAPKPASPAATLTSRMAGGDPRRPTPAPQSSDSYDIPIHVTGSDLRPLPNYPVRPAAGVPANAAPPPQKPPARSLPSIADPGEFIDDVPTEVFRPGKHVMPARSAPPPSVSATKLSPQTVLPSRAPQPQPPAPVKIAPASIEGLSGDDWDSETVVRKPAALTTMRHRERPPSARQKAAQPFNPDETLMMNKEPSIEVELDFDDPSDQAVPAPPPRRPR